MRTNLGTFVARDIEKGERSVADKSDDAAEKECAVRVRTGGAAAVLVAASFEASSQELWDLQTRHHFAER